MKPSLKEMLATNVQGEIRISLDELRQNPELEQHVALLEARVFNRLFDAGHPLATKQDEPRK